MGIFMPSTKKGGGRPSLSSQVADAIKAQIEAGYYAPGDKLPTEPALIDKFGFSRTVVREAIAALRADGLVESRQGSGVFVIGPRQSDPGLKLFTGETDKISDIIEELELRIASRSKRQVWRRHAVPRRRRPKSRLRSSALPNLSPKGSPRTRRISSFTWL